MFYYCIKEYNEHENETWFFFIKQDELDEQVPKKDIYRSYQGKTFYEILENDERFNDDDDDDDCVSLLGLYPEKFIHQLVEEYPELGRIGYMAQYNIINFCKDVFLEKLENEPTTLFQEVLDM